MSNDDNINTIYNAVQRGRPERGHSNEGASAAALLLYFRLRKQTKHAKEKFITG